MNWSGGPRAWTLTDGGGLVTVAQVVLDNDGHYQVYNFTPDGNEIWSGSGQGSTLAAAKQTAEAVARQIERKYAEAHGAESEVSKQ